MMSDEEAKLLDVVDEHFEELVCGENIVTLKEAKDNGLEQMLLLRNFEMQLFWMRYALNTLDMSGGYEKWRTKVGKINDVLGKAERALIRLEQEVQNEKVGVND